MARDLHSKAYQRLRRRLIEARQGAGLTQAQVAQRIGRPQSYISKVESGERRLDVVEFIAVARVLKLDPADLIRALTR